MLALEDTHAERWSRTTLKVVVEDTVTMRDLGIYIRYDGSYTDGPLPLRIHTSAPGGQWAEDSITAHLSGVTAGIGEAVTAYRREVVFPHKGVYTFNISGPVVRGIRAVGLIENGQGQTEKI